MINRIELTSDDSFLLDLLSSGFTLEDIDKLGGINTNKDMADTTIVKKIINDNNIVDDTTLSTARFSKAEWFNEVQQMNIGVFGVGGIGSNAAYTIGHLHPMSMRLVDPDKVDEVNLAGQLFDSQEIGEYKVDVIRRRLTNLHYFTIYAERRRITSFEPLGATDIVVAGFDNMSARKDLFNAWKRNHKSNSLFIDGRMSVNVFQLFSMRPQDKDRIADYETNWLFDDEQADTTVCSYKQTYFCATMMSGVITSLIINHAQNRVFGEQVWPVPFFIEEDTTILSRTIK